jgi:hypothetical protein
VIWLLIFLAIAVAAVWTALGIDDSHHYRGTR